MNRCIDKMGNSNDLLFKYIDPNGNDRLSMFNGKNLRYLILLLEGYYLELRDCLGISQKITFGLEIEVENVKRDLSYEEIEGVFPNIYWKLTNDYSLLNGFEVDSPILRDNKDTWLDLDKVCLSLEKISSVGRNCGGHIHIGTQILGENKLAWINFIKMWAVYENIIYRFSYGNFLTGRDSILNYAEPMANKMINVYEKVKLNNNSLDEIIEDIGGIRNQAINFNNVAVDKYNECILRNTIEFRCPNSSLDAVIWQNNVNFLVKLLEYCKKVEIDNEIIDRRYNMDEYKFDKIKWYDEVYLEQALELCDMIFTNNYDKVYFLIQYLKSFQICNGYREYPRAKLLIKKR